MDNKLKPTTIYLGSKANQLFHRLAEENGVATRYFFTKMIVREARSEATTLSGDKIKERLKLIDEVNDELVDIINNPPKGLLADRDYSMEPHSIYMRVWDAHKRLAKKGKTEEEIHEYCIERYGLDYPIKPTPNKAPRKIEVK